MALPIPNLMKTDIYKLAPDELTRRGIKLLMMDLDNTLSPYHIHEADEQLIGWINGMKRAGLELLILSNNHGDRPKHFASQLDIDYINRAKKPGTESALRLMRKKGYTISETALLGDQIYTDVLCAARCGFMSICVRPICIRRNPLLAIRYFFELPFRLAYTGDKRYEQV